MDNKLAEELTLMKTEIKEEVPDFQPIDIEFVNVHEDRNAFKYLSSSEDDLESSFNVELHDLDDNYKKPTQKSEITTDILVKRNNKQVEKYTCGDCQYTTDVERDLIRHILTHKDEQLAKARESKRFECSACGYVSKRKYLLRTHILSKHSGEIKKFKCKDCKFNTDRRPDLIRHSRIHTKEKPFKCTYKDCKCNDDQEEACECQTCDYATNRTCNLKVHMLTKHSAEGKKFKCGECAFVSHRKDKLQNHSLTHSNEKPFKCMYKDSKCMHSQNEFCDCNPCEYATTQNCHLKVHILLKHSDAVKKFDAETCI